MLCRNLFLWLISLIIIPNASAVVTDFQVSPENPVVGDNVFINGVADPNENLSIAITFSKTIVPEDNIYIYRINDVVIPSGSNSFTVTAEGVENLYVRIKMSIWLTQSVDASGGTATISQSDILPGTYDIQMDGTAAAGISSVTIYITGAKTLQADSSGNFEYNYDTDFMPAGDFELNVGGLKRIITLAAPGSNQNDGTGGSVGGSGSSGEDPDNILEYETEREYVYKDSRVSYSFDAHGNLVRFINFTGVKNSGRISAKVEILAHTSTLVDRDPPGIIYSNLNIWVGNLGWATSSNIANATINFKVSKTWVSDNNINESTIRLNRYSDGDWNPLVTQKMGEDMDYLYFESETPGFSPFAITGHVIQSDDVQPPVAEATDTMQKVEADETTAPTETATHVKRISGFGVISGIFSLFVALLINR